MAGLQEVVCGGEAAHFAAGQGVGDGKGLR